MRIESGHIAPALGVLRSDVEKKKSQNLCALAFNKGGRSEVESAEGAAECTWKGVRLRNARYAHAGEGGKESRDRNDGATCAGGRKSTAVLDLPKKALKRGPLSLSTRN